jgi:(p)ppGpp synthase/HD superfamily hydrolase
MDIDYIRKFAKNAHEGQTDLDGNPYFPHVERIEAAVEGRAKAVALLHDVLEDTDLTADDLLEAGVPNDVIMAVLVLTRTKDKTYAAYINDVAAAQGEYGDLAREVKIADLRDNLRRCRTGGRAGLAKRYERALTTLGQEA